MFTPTTIICIIVIIILFIIYFRCSKENFKINYKTIKFLNKAETCGLIKNIDYFVDLTEPDLFARKLLTKKNSVRDAYCNGFQNFSKNEKLKLTEAVNKLENNELLNTFLFAKIDSDIEYGYPHTHRDTIFMSSDTINQETKDLIYVIVHEQMHVMQRKKPELFRDLYLNYLNFKQGKLILDSSDVNLIRSNPDTRYTPEAEFIYDNGDGNFYYLNAFFTKTQPDNLGDVKYLAIRCIYSKEDNRDVYTATSEKVEINNLKNFNRFFNLFGNQYHPNEISAELISFYYSNKNKETSPALMKIDSWIKKNIIRIDI
tara:strand:+ start:894 stop:1838 length:945 start_codon:yes stop_codon:yes gene_type:complete